MAILGFLIVLVHLLVGFGFMIYKLSPKKKLVALEKTKQDSLNKEKK